VDNGVFAVEQWLADAAVFADSAAPFKNGLDVHRCTYSRMSDVVGCKGWRVTTYRELEEAMTCALSNLTSPSIIQVVLASKSIPKNAEWKVSIDKSKEIGS
jgi:indolepyruvate decarboxylase